MKIIENSTTDLRNGNFSNTSITSQELSLAMKDSLDLKNQHDSNRWTVDTSNEHMLALSLRDSVKPQNLHFPGQNKDGKGNEVEFIQMIEINKSGSQNVVFQDAE